MATQFLARFPANKKAGCTDAWHDFSFPPREYNILLPHRADTRFPSLPPSPKECTDGRRTLTSQPKFLGWVVNQIFLAMGLRLRARTRAALLLIKYREN